MVFTSAIFIFVFLPMVIASYFLIRKDLRNILLLIVSLLFYAWGEPKFLLLMLLSIVINYYFGLWIHKNHEIPSKKKVYLVLAVICNLSFLVFFKYANFLVNNINGILGFMNISGAISIRKITLPIGISFFTFQGMSYAIDVYRDDAEVQKNIFDLALYISFFPQLIAGPIVRYHDVAEQMKKREITVEKFTYGIRRFILGFAKKILIANRMGAIADDIFKIAPQNISTALIWLGALCYTLQIYYDFSGYSDMAIGLGKIFGFDFLENFNYPYIAKSIKEFWKRWHISLTNWFRDYVYIPLGGNRKGEKRSYINQIIVFLLSGLWHGASWNFIFWGAYHGAFLILERWKLGSLLNRAWKPVRYIYAIVVVIVGWVFFRVENLGSAFTYVKKMFLFTKSNSIYYPSLYFDRKSIVILILGIVFSTPILKYINKKIEEKRFKIYYNLVNVVAMIVFIISLISLAASTYNPFIYFRF